MMMIDAFMPEGITRLAVDSIFMMPQLGVLAQVNKEASMQVFNRDCLINLGTCIAPVGKSGEGKPCMSVEITMSDGSIIQKDVKIGDMVVIPLPDGESAKVSIDPRSGFDVGEGNGKILEAEVTGGVVGIIIDARGRPLQLQKDSAKRVGKLQEWAEAMGIYPR